MEMTPQENVAGYLMLAERKLVPLDLVVQVVQMYIQENGPLDDDLAARFVKLAGG